MIRNLAPPGLDPSTLLDSCVVSRLYARPFERLDLRLERLSDQGRDELVILQYGDLMPAKCALIDRGEGEEEKTRLL